MAVSTEYKTIIWYEERIGNKGRVYRVIAVIQCIGGIESVDGIDISFKDILILIVSVLDLLSLKSSMLAIVDK